MRRGRDAPDISEGNMYGWTRDDKAFGIRGTYSKHKNETGSLPGHAVASATMHIFSTQQILILALV